MERRACALVLAGALGAGALAGCTSGDDDPTPTPTPTVSSTSASPTPTPSPSPTETSTIPAAAREKSEQGAMAFARFYVEQSAVAWTKPDASLIEGLATDNCATCENLVATAKDLEAKGHRYDATPVKVASLKKFRGGGNEWIFDADLREQAVKVVDSQGDVVSQSPARKLSPAIAVVWREGRWLLDAIGE